MILFMAGTPEGTETRRRILQAVQATPGINKSELARCLGYSWGTMSHHIQRLMRQGHLRSFRDGRELHLYPADVPSSRLRQLAALQGEVPAKILSLLSERDRGIQELVGLVGSSRKVVRRLLQGMDDAKLVGRGQGLHGKFYLVEHDWVDLMGYVSFDELTPRT